MNNMSPLFRRDPQGVTAAFTRAQDTGSVGLDADQASRYVSVSDVPKPMSFAPDIDIDSLMVGALQDSNKEVMAMSMTEQQLENYYNNYRQNFGNVKQNQVDGMDFLLKRIHDDDSLSTQQKAYILATVQHETAHTFQPIDEYGKGKGRSYGRPDPETGQTYYGRGYVQLTWKRNYEVMGNLLGIDLVNKPQLANDPDVAYKILVTGMKHGLFTGKKLSNYINEKGTDYRRARKIINGMDKASSIEKRARKFERILQGL